MLAAARDASEKGTAAATPPPSTVDAGEGDATAAAMQDDVDTLDLATLQRTVQQQQARDQAPAPRAVIRRVPETTDDFIRNFLLRNGMRETLEVFEREWYQYAGATAAVSGKSRSAASAVSTVPLVPDNYLESAALLNRIDHLEHDLRQHAELTTKLTKQWEQAKKDRDFHRASHNRVVQEKNKLERLLRQARSEATDVSPALVDLRQRCESLFKAKTLVTIEKEKLEQKVGQLEKRVEELQALVTAQGGAAAPASDKRKAAAGTGRAKKDVKTASASAAVAAEGAFRWPADERPRGGAGGGKRHPAAQQQLEADPTLWSCQDSFLAHTQAATSLALHPFKPAVVTGSDDGGWRLSALPQGEAIATGQAAHANWIASVAFHPTGTLLATGSGDKTVKLWSLATNACQATLQGHTDGVWAVDFQETGELLASAGLDHTARVWDVELGKCRQTLRGHVGAVNAVRWQPFTNVLCTASGDKTVSLWDARMNCCSHSLYGHTNAVLSIAAMPPAATSAAGGTAPAAAGGGSGGALQLLSCDADGVVKLWDLRTMRPRLSLHAGGGDSDGGEGGAAANHVAWDLSGRFAAVAGDDGRVRVVDVLEETVTELSGVNGHTEAVLCVAFDPSTNGFLVSCGADRTVRYWS